MFDMVSQARVPVAVVDESNRLLGIVIRGAVLAALSGNSDVEGSEEQMNDIPKLPIATPVDFVVTVAEG